MRRKIGTLCLLMMFTICHATVYEVDGLFFTLQEDGTAKLISPSSDGEGGSSIPIGFSNGYKGDIVVPDIVNVGGETRYVTAIGDYAFLGATSLTSVTLPATVTYMGDTPFANSEKLVSITVAADNPAFCSDDGVIFNKDKTILIACPAAKAGDYDVPSTVDSIATSAFYGCGKLTSLTLPSTLSRIGIYAFRECSMLTSIVVPEGVEILRKGVFYGCRLMRTVSLPSTLTALHNAAFYYCQSLKDITLPASLQSIGASAFEECANLSEVTLPAGLQTIGSWAFSQCTKLESVTIPSTVSVIGLAPFSACTSLEAIEVESANTHYCDIDGVLFDADITRLICCPAGKKGAYAMPSTITVVGESAFLSCRKLTSVEMSPVLDTLCFSAFNGCWKFTEVKIPQSVRSIGEHVFNNCMALASVTCYAMAPPELKTNAFLTSTYNSYLYVPSRRLTTYKKTTGWRSFKNILPIPEGVEATVSEVYPGTWGTIDIALQVAETGVVSYEFDLLLPEGVSPVLGTDGGVKCTFSSRHQGTPHLTMVPLDDNAWHVTVTMGEGNSLTGYEGVVMSLTFSVAPDVAPDSYSAMVDNPVVVLADAYRVEMDYASFDLVVNAGQLGDVNMDGQVSVVDVTVMVSHLLGKYVGTFIKPLADINHDDQLTVTDVTGLVNIILGVHH